MSSIQTVRPASKMLFCKPDPAETVTRSGFLIADTAAEKPRTAQIINLGSEVSDFKQLDRVIYKPYSTTDIKLNGEDYFLIHVDDVLGVVVET